MKIRHLAAAALALGLSACAAQSSAVSIFAVCAPPAPDSATGGCLYTATCSATLAGTPVLDGRTAALPFRLPVQLNNLLADNSNKADGRVNTNDAFVQSLEITYSGGNYVAPWSPAIAVTVPTAGSAGTVFPLIQVQDFAALMPSSPAGTSHIVINVRAHGVLASQDAFTTAWFAIPVEVCDGCLSRGITCTPPALPAYCPSSASSGSPGQTASAACVTLQ
jgi:hypothetical protein